MSYSEYCFEQGFLNGIIGICQKMNVSFGDTVAMVIEQCHLSKEDAEWEVSKRWNQGGPDDQQLT